MQKKSMCHHFKGKNTLVSLSRNSNVWGMFLRVLKMILFFFLKPRKRLRARVRNLMCVFESQQMHSLKWRCCLSHLWAACTVMKGMHGDSLMVTGPGRKSCWGGTMYELVLEEKIVNCSSGKASFSTANTIPLWSFVLPLPIWVLPN